MASGLPLATAASLLLAFVGQPSWMSDAELEQAFAGKTIDGAYASGLTFTESYLANGKLDYREPGRHMTGHWSVIEGTFCTIYTQTPTGGCYRVRRMSTNCYEFYFAASDDQEAAEGGNERASWTARGWVIDRPSTCKATPSV